MADEEWERKRAELSAQAKQAVIALLEHVGPVAEIELERDDGKKVLVTVREVMPDSAEPYPLNKILRMRDKYLKKARDLEAQGKDDYAANAFQEARRWEAMLVQDNAAPELKKKAKKRSSSRTGRRSP